MPLELLQLVIPLILITIGYFFGRVLERRHYASIRRRERELKDVLTLTTRFVPPGVDVIGTDLVSGGVVVSSDYFKSFVAGFRNLVGGRFKGFETLMERGRREALLRVKEEAQRRGATLIIGVRFHTTQVAGSTTPSMEIVAYGTMIFRGAMPDGDKPGRLAVAAR
jgi:uncharacterized protein YbjQ (UPF0145 family)